MPFPFKNLPATVLRRLAHLIFHYPRWFFYPQAVLALCSMFYTVKYLEFHTSRNDLVGGEKEYHRNYLRFKEEFPVQDDLVVVVESENPEKNRQFVERLGAKLEAEPNLFTNVFFKGDLKLLGPKSLLFVETNELAELHETLQSYRPFLLKFTQSSNLVSLFDMVNTQFRTASQENNSGSRTLIEALPAIQRILSQALDSLNRSGLPPSPGIDALFGGGPEAQSQLYITFNHGRMFLITAQAPNEASNARAVDRLRQLISSTQEEVPGLNVGLTGEPVLEFDEMLQSQRDTTLATIISLIAVALIFIYGYHETGRPLKATACLLVGLIYTLAFTTLVVGHLNILTITFLPILIGLSIDFGVHLITRYEEELRHGRSEEFALHRAMVNTGQGIFTGAFTTAGAFLAMYFTDFKGIKEMGIICGGGLLVCLVPMLTLLPVLLLRGKQNILDHERGDELELKARKETNRRARVERLWLSHPGITVGITVVLSAAACFTARKVYFDYNLLEMQSAGLASVIYQNKLIASSSRSVLFGAVIANSLSEATNLEARLKQLPSVSSVDSMAGFLSENAAPKLAWIKRIKQDLAGVDFAPVDARPVDLREFTQTLLSLDGYLGLSIPEVEKAGETNLMAQLQSLRTTVKGLVQRMITGREEEVRETLTLFQVAFFKDLRETFNAIKSQVTDSGLRPEDLPSVLRNRFIGVNGKYPPPGLPEERRVGPERTGGICEGTPQRRPHGHRHAGPAFGVHHPFEKQLSRGRALFAARYRCACLGPLPPSFLRHPCSDPGRRRRPMDGRIDGGTANSVQSREYHDVATDRRDWGDQRHSHPQPLFRGTTAEHSRQKHRQSGLGVRTHDHRGVWQSYPRQTPGDQEPGRNNVDWRRHVHDRGTDIPAGDPERADSAWVEHKKTQRRQCTVNHWVGRNRG